MSVLNKTPFIQTLINSLSASEKASLLDCINGKTTVKKYSLVLRDLSVSTPIESIQLETKTQIYNGYKIYKSGNITFLMYNVGQEISMYQVSYPYYEKELKGRIKENVSIEEFRRYLEGTGAEIDSGEIDSGSATEGQVLTADGEGGAEWQDVPDSVGTKLYRYDLTCSDSSHSNVGLTFYCYESFDISDGVGPEFIEELVTSSIGIKTDISSSRLSVNCTIEFHSSDLIITCFDSTVSGSVKTVVLADFESELTIDSITMEPIF